MTFDNTADYIPIKTPVVQFELQADPTVNYAMQQNNVPLIKRLCVQNVGDERIPDLTIRITTIPCFAKTKEIRLATLAPGQISTFDIIDMPMEHDFLVGLSERLVGEINVQAVHDDKVLGEVTQKIHILAYDEWNGLQSLPSIIAAFVVPNHPAVEDILSLAADTLREWTGSSALSGYQTGNPNAVLKMAGSIYYAIRKQKLRYINPPASFEERGQKVRLPDRILEHRLATCLDLTLFFAACIEQCGIHPLILLMKNHATVGFWLKDEAFQDTVIKDRTALRKRVDLNEIRFLETTVLTADTPIDFNQSIHQGLSYLDDEHGFCCAIDISCSRRSGIRPLPLRVLVSDYEEEKDIENDTDKSPDLPQPEQIEVVENLRASDSTASVSKLENWQRKLLDLSLGNRLLNFRQTQKTLPLMCPDPGILEDKLAEGSSVKILPRPKDWTENDPRSYQLSISHSATDPLEIFLRQELESHRLIANATETDLNRRLLSIYREARLSQEESGSNTLYLVLGMLDWYEIDRSEIKHSAPVLMIPLEITRNSVHEGFSICRSDEEITINTTLIYKLEHDHGLYLSELDPLPEDEHGIDVERVFHTITQAIRELPRWELKRQTWIGHFSFAKHLMWRDLRDRTEDLMNNSLVAYLIKNSSSLDEQADFIDEENLDETHLPIETFCPLSFDSSQLAAILTAAKGKSFVLHGPPGTGKSQTITNLIAHALAMGKTVLFVSEKRAALEVVYKRLKECGLDEFCLELHSNKSRKADVLEQLRVSFESRNTPQSGQFLREALQLSRLRAQLNRFVKALHAPQDIGVSVFQGISRVVSLQNKKRIKLNLVGNTRLTAEQLEEWQSIAEKMHVAAQVIDHPSKNCWAFSTQAKWKPSLEEDFNQALLHTAKSITDLSNTFNSTVAKLGLAGMQANKHLLELLKSTICILLEYLPNIPISFLQLDIFPELGSNIETLIARGRERNLLRFKVNSTLHDSALQLDTPPVAQAFKAAANDWLAKFSSHYLATDNTDWFAPLASNLLPLLENLVELAIRLNNKVKEIHQRLSLELNWDSLENIIALGEMAGLLNKVPKHLPKPLVCEPDWADVLNKVQDMETHGRKFLTLREQLLETFTPSILTIDTNPLREKYNLAMQKWFFARWLAIKSIRKELAMMARAGKTIASGQIAVMLESIAYLREEERFLAAANSQGCEYLGHYWHQEYDIDWDEVNAAMYWCGQIRKALASLTGHNQVTYTSNLSKLYDDINRYGNRLLPEGDIGSILANYHKTASVFTESFAQLNNMLDNPELAAKANNGTLPELVAMLKGMINQSQLILSFRPYICKTDDMQVTAIIKQLDELETLQNTNTWFDSQNSYAEAVLGEHWNNSEADWDAIQKLLAARQIIMNQATLLGKQTGILDNKLLARWSELRDSWSNEIANSLHQYQLDLQSYHDSLTALVVVLEINEIPLFQDKQDLLAAQFAWVNKLIKHLPDLRDWCHWRQVRQTALDNKLESLVATYEKSEIATEEIVDVFTRSFYEDWVENVIANNHELDNFYSPDFEHIITTFRELDQSYRELTKKEIKARLFSNRRQFTGGENPASEPGILHKEILKKRRQLPVRKLLQKIPNLLPQLKPCLLMSPISVAQYLDPAFPPFDMVVFDEASQIPTWDAIGAIARGKKAVIVGDSKQLPPTNFFQRSASDDELEPEEYDDLESILDECVAVLDSHYLKWHYRSRHESLITFSNCKYYANKLLTFPSPHQNKKVNVRWVDGTYDRSKSRTNLKEAQEIVQEVITRLQDVTRCEQSIGIITFSQAQQSLIEDLLDEERRKNTELEKYFNDNASEPVFTKNLENVQGDERDVILFSIGYGPDPVGKVSMNFGPLNRDGGERRLNVAVTRARAEILVFSSINPDQIDLNRVNAKGVKHLKTFLEYAENGTQALFNELQWSQGECESPFEEQVMSALVDKGHTVHAQVGCSGYRIDLAIVDPKNPGRYLLGVECDGANYHSAKTARDRDLLRQEILEGLGWRLHRIWSTDWWHNPKGEMQKLEQSIISAKQTPVRPIAKKTNTPVKADVDKPIIDSAPITAENKSLRRIEYKTYAINNIIGNPSELYLVKPYVIRQILLDIVNFEGPILDKLAVRKVIAHWGMKNVTNKNFKWVMKALQGCFIKVVNHHERSFLWSKGEDPQTYKYYRVSKPDDNTQRNPEEIPPEEAANAALEISEQNIGLPHDALVNDMAREFGFKRSGANVVQYMSEGIAILEGKGLIKE